MSHLVSVIIATFNSAHFVGQAIESVLRQSYSPIELHIVDDGSTDGTQGIVAPFLRDSRVTYHRRNHAGQAAAKNWGIRSSRGPFVAFCDADDMWLPYKLAVQMPAFDENERVGVVYSRSVVITERGERVRDPSQKQLPSGVVTERLFKSNFIPFGTAVVRRSCLDNVGAFDERYEMGIDWDLWLRVSLKYHFYFVDQETYLYRRWQGQLSRNWKKRYECAFEIMRTFQRQHPGVLRRAVVREAWADSYAQRARYRAILSGDYLGGVVDCTRAIVWRPQYLLGWRTLARIIALMVGIRGGS